VSLKDITLVKIHCWGSVM